MPKDVAPCKCLSIIPLDSVIKAKKKFYPQTFFGRMQMWTKEDKNGEPSWLWFRKTFVWWVW